MYRSFLAAGLSATALLCNAQTQVHQVVVLNEGYFDYFGDEGQVVPVTLGSYDPGAGTYQTVATINGPRFASHVIVNDGSIYVAADDRVLRYDAGSFEQLAMAPVSGVRKLAVWNDQLLLTRGELGGLSHYFEARDKQSLDLLETLDPADGLVYSAEDVVVIDDKAYLAVSNAFTWGDLQGRIGVVDLGSWTYESEVDLGPEGLNPEKLMVHEGLLYAFNNKDFTGSSISRMTLGGTSLDYTTNVATNSGCAASVLADGRIYFLEYAQADLARFDIATGAVLDTLPGTPEVYGLIDDPVNDVLYATTTDYLTSGELHVMSREGEVISTVAVGVAPGNMALDIRELSAVAETAPEQLRVYPNPADEVLFVASAQGTAGQAYHIVDLTGRVVMDGVQPLNADQRINVSGLRAGVYLIRSASGVSARFTKL